MRARTELMDIALVGIGRYAVATQSGGEYRVDVVERGCTCPDWTEHQPDGGCKHMRRVNLEILASRVPRPDGRLPVPFLADGGRPTPSSDADRSSEAGESNDDDPPTASAEVRAPIEGPFWERDQYGSYTGVTYYRCRRCGVEALRRRDLRDHPCEHSPTPRAERVSNR